MTYPNKKTQLLDCKQGAVRCVRFNVDGNYCLTSGSDKTVKLWNPLRNLHLKTYTGHGYEVMEAQSSSDNSHICSGGMDKAVVLFDVATGQAVKKYRDHAGCSESQEKLSESCTSLLVARGQACPLITIKVDMDRKVDNNMAR